MPPGCPGTMRRERPVCRSHSYGLLSLGHGRSGRAARPATLRRASGAGTAARPSPGWRRRAPSPRVRNVSAMPRAVIITWKHSSIVAGAMTTCGASPGWPKSAASRSDCSTLVGSPVLGPPRCTSTSTSGISVITASPRNSVLSASPGPDVIVNATLPAYEAPMRDAGRRDLVLGLVHDAAELLEHLAQVVRHRRRRRDRVHRAQLHPRGDRAQPIASLPFITTSASSTAAAAARRRGSRGAASAQRVPELQQRHVLLVDLLALLPERVGDLLADAVHGRGRRCQASMPSANMFLPLRGLSTTVRHCSSIGTSNDPVVARRQLRHRRGPTPRGSSGSSSVGPHVLDQDARRRRRARRAGGAASSTCSLNATTRLVASPQFVTGVRPDADPVAARAVAERGPAAGSRRG